MHCIALYRYLALLAMGGLVVLGRVMVFLRESERLGLLTAWGFHAGLDACLCLVLLQMYTHFVPGFPGRLRD